MFGLPRPFKIGPLWPWANKACAAVNHLLLRSLKPDIYHPTYYRLFTRPPGTRLVVTVYDMIHEKHPNFFVADNTAEIKREMLMAADAIISISESTRRDLLHYYPELDSKTSVVYLAAAPVFSASRIVQDDQFVNLRYALFVGSRDKYKGFDVVLDSWQSIVKNFPMLNLVCAGGGAFSPSEMAQIQGRGLQGTVRQMSASDERLAGMYRSAELLVYPSRYEGFGLPVLEAMICGCPVVCSHSSSLPEVGGDAASYFEVGDAGDLTVKIEAILNDQAHRDELVLAGYEQSRQFSWERCATETVEVYRRCLALPSA